MTQGELEKIPLLFERKMSELEMRVMSEIVRAIRVNGFSTATADWQIHRLIQMGESRERIEEYVKEALNATDEEIERIFSDDVYEYYYGYQRAYGRSGVEQKPFEENRELQSLISSVRSQTEDTFQNMTGSTGFAIRNPATGKIQYSPLMEFYQDTLDGAVMEIASGSSSYDKVLSRAINTMTNSGLRWIDYNSGAHFRVDVAARMAVMTGFRQVQGKINEQVAKELGTDSYEVTYHIGARPTHQPWQGKVWTYEELESVCGLGSVTGLHGANCYHDYNAFIPGVSVRTYTDAELEEMIAEENTPKDYNGKEYTTYEALQEQRKMERNMRKTRQDIKLLQDGGADKETVILKQARYQLQMQQYKSFSNAMKLPEQKARVYQDGLGRVGTKTKTFFVAEQSLITKKKDKNMYSVNRELLNSKTYHDKFEQLPAGKKIQESIYRECGKLLEICDGKSSEHMTAINKRTGEFIVNNFARSGETYRTSFNLEEYAKIAKCKDEIVLIHNHSTSVRPSGTDIVSFVKNDKIGISVIACHDGDIYAIVSGKKEVEEIYNKAYNDFRRIYDADTSKTMATRVLYEKNANGKLFDLRRL